MPVVATRLVSRCEGWWAMQNSNLRHPPRDGVGLITCDARTGRLVEQPRAKYGHGRESANLWRTPQITAAWKENENAG
jgi:hypothetical protein